MPPATRRPASGPGTGATALAGRAVLCLLLLLLTACTSGSDGDGSAPSSGPTAGSSSTAPSAGPATGDLVVDLDRGDGGTPEHYTLTCGDPVSGDLPDASAACAHLQGLPDPFAALPADQVCTQQFGGPQTAVVTGRWNGADVRLELARGDGCEISQWDRLGPLLPGPVG